MPGFCDVQVMNKNEREPDTTPTIPGMTPFGDSSSPGREDVSCVHMISRHCARIYPAYFPVLFLRGIFGRFILPGSGILETL